MKESKNMLTRVEKHMIRPSSPWFPMLDEYCYLAKNLYNHGNYIVRDNFINNSEWMRYNELDRILKKDLEHPDYKAMPTAQTAQQVLRLLDKNWKSFFATIKDWKEHKDKYLGRPKMPKYKKKRVVSLCKTTLSLRAIKYLSYFIFLLFCECLHRLLSVLLLSSCRLQAKQGR